MSLSIQQISIKKHFCDQYNHCAVINSAFINSINFPTPNIFSININNVRCKQCPYQFKKFSVKNHFSYQYTQCPVTNSVCISSSKVPSQNTVLINITSVPLRTTSVSVQEIFSQKQSSYYFNQCPEKAMSVSVQEMSRHKTLFLSIKPVSRHNAMSASVQAKSHHKTQFLSI
jgi:hypothetical protein